MVGELRLGDHLPPACRAFTRPSVGVVVQVLLDPDTAGVMFTQNPVTGADERVIEASWGLGEAVVAGRVIPDNYRVDRAGEVLERTPGRKNIAFRTAARGRHRRGSRSRPSSSRRCASTTSQLARAEPARRRAASRSTARARDIEWAIADGTLYLLQCRAVTRAGV